MDLCEAIERFFSGDKELLEKYPEIRLMILLGLMKPAPPFLLTPLSPILDSMKYAKPEKAALMAIVLSHLIAYKVPLNAIKDHLERAFTILREAYEKCGSRDIAIALAETAMHLGKLYSKPKTVTKAAGYFQKALILLNTHSDDSIGFRRSLVRLYTVQADSELLVGEPFRALMHAKVAERYSEGLPEKYLLPLRDVLARANRLVRKEEEAYSYIDKILEVVKPTPIGVQRVAFLYIYTGYEPAYERLIELLEPVKLLTPPPFIALAKAYNKIEEDREEGMTKLANLARLPDPLISSLARILMARADLDLKRVRKYLDEAVDRTVKAGIIEIALLAIREGERKGLSKKDLEKRKKKIREAYKRGVQAQDFRAY